MNLCIIYFTADWYSIFSTWTIHQITKTHLYQFIRK